MGDGHHPKLGRDPRNHPLESPGVAVGGAEIGQERENRGHGWGPLSPMPKLVA